MIVLKIIEVSATAQKQSENNPLKPKVVFKDAQGCAVTMQNLKVKEMFNGFAYLAQHRQDFLQCTAGDAILALPARRGTAAPSGLPAKRHRKPNDHARLPRTAPNTAKLLKIAGRSLKIRCGFRVLALGKRPSPQKHSPCLGSLISARKDGCSEPVARSGT